MKLHPIVINCSGEGNNKTRHNEVPMYCKTRFYKESSNTERRTYVMSKVAFLLANDFEDSEMQVPYDEVKKLDMKWRLSD